MRKLFQCIIWLVMAGGSINSIFAQSLWNTAKSNKDALAISTLFIAQDVRQFLSTPSGLDNAVNWCRQSGVTRVFIETFRDGIYSDKETMVRAKDRFLKEGFDVSGCVTTVTLGKDGVGGWNTTPCFTNKATLDELRHIFEISASLFDVIMIDDFLFTECTCEDCITARGDQSWTKFRCDQMSEVSREYILKPARNINPDVKIIIKYPLWYDEYQDRGYDVVKETRDYDYIWVGTETRDYDYNVRPGGEVQYNACFIMKWMGEIGGAKTGGGWIDALGTTPKTYVEQARQTVLGNGKEIMLFHYGNLLEESNFYDDKPGTGVADVEAFRKELPGLIELARIIKEKPLRGIHMPKPPSSEPYNEKYVFSFFGMLGLPLLPAYETNEQAEAAVFSVHALSEPGFSGKLKRMLEAGKPVVITDGLARAMADQELLKNKNLTVLKLDKDPKNLLKLSQADLRPIRDKLMAHLGLQFDAPNKVAFYLFGNNNLIIENFNDEPADVTIRFNQISDIKMILTLPVNANAEMARDMNKISIHQLAPRTLVAFEYR